MMPSLPDDLPIPPPGRKPPPPMTRWNRVKFWTGIAMLGCFLILALAGDGFMCLVALVLGCCFLGSLK